MANKSRKMTVTVDDSLTKKLQSMQKGGVYKICKELLYDPAGMLADEIKGRLREHKDTGDLVNSVTVSKMIARGGVVQTAVVFAGYDKKGVPNPIKAAVLESGSSKQKKTPFIRPAVKAVESKIGEKMTQDLNNILAKYMEE